MERSESGGNYLEMLLPMLVLKSSVKWPGGWEFWKGILGQRIFLP
jgi:hypothetical protein